MGWSVFDICLPDCSSAPSAKPFDWSHAPWVMLSPRVIESQQQEGDKSLRQPIMITNQIK